MSEQVSQAAAATADRLLSADPYCLPALVRRLLFAARRGDADGAARDHAILSRLYPSSRSLWMLQRVASGSVAFEERSGVFVLRSEDVGKETADGILRHACDAVAASAAVCTQPPLIVVELIREAPPLALLSNDIPGLHHLLLTGERITSPPARATVFHEVGHALLSCGCRFLDEGWAVYFSYQGDDQYAYPMPRKRVAGFADANRAALADLHALLCLPANGGLLFEDVAADGNQRRLIYVQGYLLIAHLVRTFGLAALAGVFTAIRQARNPSLNATIVERVVGRSVARLQAEIVGRPEGEEGQSAGVEYEAILEMLVQAGEQDGATQLDDAIRRLRCRRGSVRGDHAATLVLCRLLFARLDSAPPPLAILLRSEISALLAELDQDGVAYAEFFRMRTRLAELEARISADPFEQASWRYRAEEARRTGLLSLLMSGPAGEICRFERPDGAGRRASTAAPVRLDHDAGNVVPAPGPASPSRQIAGTHAEPIAVIRDMRVRLRSGFELAVSGLEIFAEEVVAIIGANGAGKTTLLGGLAGLIRLDRCEGTLLGVPLVRWRHDRTKRGQLGVQLQRLTQHPGIRVGELVRLHRSIYRQSAEDVFTALNMGELMHRAYGALSQGQRQRTNIYLAAAHRPSLLILDEPTAALDQRFRYHVHALFDPRSRRLPNTVLFSSHVAEDVRAADRIVWLKDGSIVAVGDLASLVDRFLAPFRGVINCATPTAAVRIRCQWEERGIARVVRMRGENRVVLFGNEDLQAAFHESVHDPDVVSYRFGVTGAPELLALASGIYQ